MTTASQFLDRSGDLSATAISHAMVTPVRGPRPTQLLIAALTAPLVVVTALAVRVPAEN